MKTELNSPCPCGSGLKYKKCCIDKSLPVPEMKISSDGLLSIIAFGLENAHLLNKDSRKIDLKNTTFLNGGDTILVEFYSQQTNSNDIKGEMAYIMAFLFSFLKDKSYDEFHINMFAARAFDKSDVEIMHALNNSESAGKIAGGNPLEWYKTTIFQENTSDYRLSRAKTMISEIENGLRKAIGRIYHNKLGLNWWNIIIEPKLSKSIKGTYENQFGVQISEGDILINYTYILDLKKIISADWGSFRHLFDNKMDFESIMIELNNIRREEAHNRNISQVHLVDLERIYDQLLGEIANLYDDVTTKYLLDNWKTKISQAMVNPPTCAYTTEQFEAQDILGRRELIIKDCNTQIGYLSNVVTKLSSLKPPASKKKKHDEMIALLQELAALQRQKLDQVENFQLDNYQDLIKNISEHYSKMNLFSREFLISES